MPDLQIPGWLLGIVLAIAIAAAAAVLAYRDSRNVATTLIVCFTTMGAVAGLLLLVSANR